MPPSDFENVPTDLPTAVPPTVPTAVPTPVAGAGSAELVTGSDDPRELRALLERARERLSFYESFDRIIGENFRRMGEMMAETVALREQAAQAARDRQVIDEEIRRERERHREILKRALAGARNVQPGIDAMVTRLEEALGTIGGAGMTTEGDAPGPTPEPEATVPTPEPAAEESAPETSTVETGELVATPPASEEDIPDLIANHDETPTAIEVLAHGVPSAATAIGLQAMLREIDAITRVDAREFADGELRLHVECTGPIADDAFSGWLAQNSGSLVSRSAKAIELSFS
jgi:hypothetical protein